MSTLVRWSDEADAVIRGDITAAAAYVTPAGGAVVTAVAPCGLGQQDRHTGPVTTFPTYRSTRWSSGRSGRSWDMSCLPGDLYTVPGHRGADPRDHPQPRRRPPDGPAHPPAAACRAGPSFLIIAGLRLPGFTVTAA